MNKTTIIQSITKYSSVFGGNHYCESIKVHEWNVSKLKKKTKKQLVYIYNICLLDAKNINESLKSNGFL